MPRLAKPLTEVQVRNAKPKATAYRLADGNGLYLTISPAGLKAWVVRYRLPGSTTHTPATLGHYPAMTLKCARERAVEAHRDAKRGIPIPGVRKARKQATEAARAERSADAQAQAEAAHAGFRALSARWLAEKRPGWSSETYRQARYIVDDYLVPEIGDKDMRTLATREVKPALLAMWAKTPSIAKKARQYIAGIVEMAMDEGLRNEDSALRLSRIFPRATKGHMPAVTDDNNQLSEVVRAIDAYPGRVVRAALVVAATTAARPGMVVSAKWEEINMETGEWRIPAGKMKTRQPFTTSLPRQALGVLQEMQALHAAFPHSPCKAYVFPAQARQKTPHIHRDTLSKAFRDMGFQGKQTAHGLRATFRSIARARLNAPVDVLEAQLAHGPKDEVQAAYARAEFREQRREVLQQWADYLDSLRDGAKVVPFKRKA